MMKGARELPEQLSKRLRTGRQTRPSDINSRYEELKTIGYGWEGYVYLIKDQSTGDKLVLKIFHEPPASDGLKLYADRVKSNKYGLYQIMLLQESDRIIALQYPFVALDHISYRIFDLVSCTARLLFGQFCLMQWYLMSHHGIGLTDPQRTNFLLAPNRRFHYIDYGRNISSITNPRALARGLFGYGFAMLLLDIYNTSLKLEMGYSFSYSYNKPCIYNMCEALDVIAARKPWVREILSEVRSQNGSIFLDPDFYWRLGMSLPQRIYFPQVIVSTSKLLRTVRGWVTGRHEANEQ